MVALSWAAQDSVLTPVAYFIQFLNDISSRLLFSKCCINFNDCAAYCIGRGEHQSEHQENGQQLILAKV